MGIKSLGAGLLFLAATLGFGAGIGPVPVNPERENPKQEQRLEEKLDIPSQLSQEAKEDINDPYTITPLYGVGKEGPTENPSIYMTGHVFQDWAGQPLEDNWVDYKLYRSFGDTLTGAFIVNDDFSRIGTSFNPDAQEGDTVYCFAWDRLDPSRSTIVSHVLEEGTNRFLGTCLDDSTKAGTAFTTNYGAFCDTSSVTQPLTKYAVSWVGKNPTQKDTVEVDSLNAPYTVDYDYWYNTELQDSIVADGDTIYTTFFANLPGDSIAYTNTFAVIGENTFSNGILGADTVWFPEHVGPTAVAENEQETPKYSTLSFYPTVTKGQVYCQNPSGLEKKVDVYDVTGRKRGEYVIGGGQGEIDLSGPEYSSEILFIKPEGENSKPTKVVKTN